MAEFEVEIKEILSKKIIIQAENLAHAKRKAWLNYEIGHKDFILNKDNSTLEIQIDVIAKQEELFK